MKLHRLLLLFEGFCQNSWFRPWNFSKLLFVVNLVPLNGDFWGLNCSLWSWGSGSFWWHAGSWRNGSNVGYKLYGKKDMWNVSKNRGKTPPNWMVKIMENPLLKWMIWGYHYFRKHPCLIRIWRWYVWKTRFMARMPRMPMFYLIPEESEGKPPQKGSMTSFFGAGWLESQKQHF